MTAPDRLIDDILAASRIPFQSRRREVLRELRAHVDDFISEKRLHGLPDQEIERLLLERFGDPSQIAAQFAWVYRRDRAAAHLIGFLIATFLVAFLIAVAALSLRAGVMIGLGAPASAVFASRHTASVAFNVLATAAAYLGLLSLRRFFTRPLVVLTAIAAGLLALFFAAGLPAQYILFGFANGALLHAIHNTLRHPVLRFIAALACFAALASIFFHPSSSALAATAISWLIMGSAYHGMTHLAARVDQALLGDF